MRGSIAETEKYRVFFRLVVMAPLTRISRRDAPLMLATSRSRTVCRFHGERGGAPRGQANGAYRHGLYTAKAAEERRRLRELLDQVRETVAGLT